MNEQQIKMIHYLSAMRGCYAAMSNEEKQTLQAWENSHVGGSGEFSSSDWPGWEKYIGAMPSISQVDKDRFGFVYLIQSGSTPYYKIGVSKNVSARLASLQAANPEELKLIYSIPSANAGRLESELHRRFDQHRVHREWFCLEDKDVMFICSIEHNRETGDKIDS